MVFELWEFTDHVSKCFARRTDKTVKKEFHSMKVGEQRKIADTHYIMRVK